MKLWERVIEKRLRRDISILKNHFGFMLGRSTIEAIYLIRRLVKLYKDKKKDHCMMFIILDKMYDRVPYEIMGVFGE